MSFHKKLHSHVFKFLKQWTILMYYNGAEALVQARAGDRDDICQYR